MHYHPILKSPAKKDRIPEKVSLIRQDHLEIGFAFEMSFFYDCLRSPPTHPPPPHLENITLRSM